MAHQRGERRGASPARRSSRVLAGVAALCLAACLVATKGVRSLSRRGVAVGLSPVAWGATVDSASAAESEPTAHARLLVEVAPTNFSMTRASELEGGRGASVSVQPPPPQAGGSKRLAPGRQGGGR